MPKLGGTIYAIGVVGTSWVKIGRTTGPVMQRLKTLQTGQPCPLQVLAAIPVETDAHRIEKYVHAFLEAKKQRGEWFAISMDTATLEALIVRAIAWIEAMGEAETLETMAHAPTVLGARIRHTRARVGMSQAELAHAAGLNTNTVSRLEQGDLHDLGGQSVAKLAQALHTTTDFLLGLSENPEQGTSSADKAATTPAAPSKATRTPRKATSVA